MLRSVYINIFQGDKHDSDHVNLFTTFLRDVPDVKFAGFRIRKNQKIKDLFLARIN